MRWRLDCRPRTPARHDLRRDISEHRRADPDRADRHELLDLRQHRLQAHLARSLLDLSKDRTLVLVDVGVGRVAIVVDGDEHPDPKLGVGAQAPRDPHGQSVLTKAQSRADDSIDPPGSRRLDQFAATAHEQLFANALGATLDLRDMLDQPRRQLLGISDGALAKTEVLADLRAMMLDRAPRPLIRTELRRRDLHLARDKLHDRARQIPAGRREPAVPRIELQQQREAQPRRATLARYQRPLVIEHRPMLNEVIQIDLRRRRHGPSLAAPRRRRKRMRRATPHVAADPPLAAGDSILTGTPCRRRRSDARALGPVARYAPATPPDQGRAESR